MRLYTQSIPTDQLDAQQAGVSGKFAVTAAATAAKRSLCIFVCPAPFIRVPTLFLLLAKLHSSALKAEHTVFGST